MERPGSRGDLAVGVPIALPSARKTIRIVIRLWAVVIPPPVASSEPSPGATVLRLVPPARRRVQRSALSGRMSEAERAEHKALVLEMVREGTYERRPLTDDLCPPEGAPCPFVSCRHHLYLDVDPDTGALKLNFPGLDVDELEETCSLRVARSGRRRTLAEVGRRMNLTQEAARQIQVEGLRKYRRRMKLGLPAKGN